MPEPAGFLQQAVEPFEPCSLHPEGCSSPDASDEVERSPHPYGQGYAALAGVARHPELLLREA